MIEKNTVTKIFALCTLYLIYSIIHYIIKVESNFVYDVTYYNNDAKRNMIIQCITAPNFRP